MKAGDLFIHKKSGDTYEFIMMFRNEADNKEHVLYRRSASETAWGRPLTEFQERFIRKETIMETPELLEGAGVRKVILETELGELAKDATPIPPFSIEPEVIMWGNRVFKKYKRGNDPVLGVTTWIYRECFTYFLVD